MHVRIAGRSSRYRHCRQHNSSLAIVAEENLKFPLLKAKSHRRTRWMGCAFAKWPPPGGRLIAFDRITSLPPRPVSWWRYNLRGWLASESARMERAYPRLQKLIRGRRGLWHVCIGSSHFLAWTEFEKLGSHQSAGAAGCFVAWRWVRAVETAGRCALRRSAALRPSLDADGGSISRDALGGSGMRGDIWKKRWSQSL